MNPSSTASTVDVGLTLHSFPTTPSSSPPTRSQRGCQAALCPSLLQRNVIQLYRARRRDPRGRNSRGEAHSVCRETRHDDSYVSVSFLLFLHQRPTELHRASGVQLQRRWRGRSDSPTPTCRMTEGWNPTLTWRKAWTPVDPHADMSNDMKADGTPRRPVNLDDRVPSPTC